MKHLVKQYELALTACKIVFPLGFLFLEILGIALWIALADTGYGVMIGLPIMLFGVIMGIIFYFSIKYMKRKLKELCDAEKELSDK